MVAHLKHLKEHGETGFLKQAVGYLKLHASEIPFSVDAVISEVHNTKVESSGGGCASGGCPGSKEVSFEPQTLKFAGAPVATEAPSALRQWPVQMHLINPAGATFQGTDLLLAADCVAFSMGNFHSKFFSRKIIGDRLPQTRSGQRNIRRKKFAGSSTRPA